MMPPSNRSLRGLDLVNVFMADVKDGVGVYLSAYLLTVHHWEPSHIGVVGALPWIVAILVQSPIGSFIDHTRMKRLLLVAASAIVAMTCLVVIFLPTFVPIAASQVALGIAQTTFPPCVAAISLGVVGHARMARRVGRNESFNHAGNMLAAALAIFMAASLSYEGVFYFSLVQCAAIVGATLLIRRTSASSRSSSP
jgi:predicted MFS family arabinose efflux permease